MQQQAGDIEQIAKNLRVVLEYVVRLECRLESEGILKGRALYGDTELRYSLENNVELEPREDRELVSYEYQRFVADWLEQHEDDERIGFYDLEAALGGRTERIKLIKTLEIFVIRDTWIDLIERMTTEGAHPSETKNLVKRVRREYLAHER